LSISETCKGIRFLDFLFPEESKVDLAGAAMSV
jgi:hypothetical protein